MNLKNINDGYRVLMNTVADGVAVIGPDYRIIETNLNFAAMLGYSLEEISRLHARDLQAHLADAEIESFYTRLAGAKHGLETSFKHKDGSLLKVRARAARAVRGEEPVYLCICRDDKGQRKAETAHRQDEEACRPLLDDYEKIFHGTKVAMFLVEVVDEKSFRFLITNRAYQHKTGFGPDQAAGNTPRQLLGEKAGRAAEARFRKCIRDQKACTYEETVNLPAGKRIYETTLSPHFQEGRAAYIVGSSQDITERKQEQERLHYASLHDPLTDLYNRAFFEEEMRRLEKSRAYPITIIVADLDGLKTVNDTLGHAAGDELLKACAGILTRSLRSSDILARVGGDEFSALLPHSSRKASREIAGRIRAHVLQYNREHPHLTLSLSIGVATAESKPASLQELYRQADSRMYLKKRP